MYKGKLFFSERERRNLLAQLLDNVGADVAVRLGDPQVWKDAVRHL